MKTRMISQMLLDDKYKIITAEEKSNNKIKLSSELSKNIDNDALLLFPLEEKNHTCASEEAEESFDKLNKNISSLESSPALENIKQDHVHGKFNLDKKMGLDNIIENPALLAEYNKFHNNVDEAKKNHAIVKNYLNYNSHNKKLSDDFKLFNTKHLEQMQIYQQYDRQTVCEVLAHDKQELSF